MDYKAAYIAAKNESEFWYSHLRLTLEKWDIVGTFGIGFKTRACSNQILIKRLLAKMYLSVIFSVHNNVTKWFGYNVNMLITMIFPHC